jgi:hypothetical protein
MSDKEQTKTESDASEATVPPAGNEPPGQHPKGGNAAPAGGSQEQPRISHEKRIREWLLVVFTGVIVGGTWYYACTAKKQAQTMIEQRDTMIQQVNASQRQIDEMKNQTNTFNETLGETRRNANAAVNSADSGQRSATAAEQGVGVTAQSMRYGDAAYVVVQGANTGDFKVGEKISAIITLINAGNTPAYEFVIYSYMQARDKPPSMQRVKNIPGDISKSLVGPRGTLDLPIISNFVIPNDESVKILQQGNPLRLYLWGRVEYVDIFKRKRWMTFCMLHRPGTNKLQPCTYGNDGN